MQDVCIAKRLHFGCTASLTGDGADDLQGPNTRLAEMAVSLETLVKSVEDHTSDTTQAAVLQMQGVCSDQMLKRQLQSLKASFINLGQKESFAEAIKSFFRSNDFKPEADRAAGAVESAEEDLNDLKKINQQDEEQLRHLVHTVSAYHDQYQSVVARVSQRMALSMKEWEAYEASKQPSNASTDNKATEAEQEVLLAQGNTSASRLESQIVAAQTECTDTEAALQAQLDDVAVLRAEVEQLQAVKEDQVKEADTHLHRSNQWCEEMLEVMSRTTGLSLVSIEEDCVHVQLRQEVPLSLDPMQEHAEVRVLEHTLSMHLVPGSSRLDSAVLEPQSVDIAREVEMARWHHGSLQLLVSAVRGRLYAAHRRQLLIEEASKRHSLTPVPGSATCVRATLMAGGREVEVEVDVPGSWPDGRQGLSLVSVRAAGSAADQRTEGANPMPAASVLARLHASAGKEGVPRFLAAVAASLPLSL